MQQSVENVFARSWDLLTKNWIIIVPGAVIGAIVGLLTALLAPDSYAGTGDPMTQLASASSRFASAAIIGTIGVAGYVVTQCYTAGMAGAAWMRGTTSLEDGAIALRTDAGNVIVAAIGLFVIGVVAAVLALPTLGLSFLAYYVFFIYAIASAVVGARPGMEALRESMRIAWARFAPTFIIAIVLVVLRIAGGFVALAFSWAPLIGPIVAAIISQIVVAFATLVVVGEYLNLRGAQASQPPQTPPTV